MSDTTTQPWTDTSLAPRERAQLLVAAMTLEQKIQQLHGNMETIDIYALVCAGHDQGGDGPLAAQIRIERHVAAIDELGIPRFRITNGPVGVGMGDGTPSPPATSLPMTIALAAGFDPELAHQYGDLIGSETATLGQHVLEGPGVCLHRTEIAGRNFEYFSEDPYLSGVMGVEVTKAIQSHDVIAMGKHYAVNDQEYERFRTNVEVDEGVAARDVPAALRDVGQGRRDRRDHERLQPGARGVRHREPVPAHDDPARGVGLRGLRAVGLLELPLEPPRRSTRAWTTRWPTPSGSTRPTSSEGAAHRQHQKSDWT